MAWKSLPSTVTVGGSTRDTLIVAPTLPITPGGNTRRSLISTRRTLIEAPSLPITLGDDADRRRFAATPTAAPGAVQCALTNHVRPTSGSHVAHMKYSVDLGII